VDQKRQKRAARDVQELTGWSYMKALYTVRGWLLEKADIKEKLMQLAKDTESPVEGESS
jgi:hypothetical protein